MPARLTLLSAALTCFARDGFEATTMRAIAEEAGVPLDEAFGEAPSKHAFALALYQGQVTDLQDRLSDLPRGTIAERFDAMMRIKLDQLEVHRSAMRALVAAAVDSKGPVGVMSDATAAIRSRMSGTVHAVIAGATDAPSDPAKLSALLYAAHLAIVLLWTQDDDGKMARGALGALTEMLAMAGPFLAMPMVSDRLGKLHSLFGDRFGAVANAKTDEKARWILSRIMRHRRLFPGIADAPPTEEELAPHLPLVAAALSSAEPLTLVLPAFPAKSPNREKVLGALPDMAERVALRSLETLCEELSDAHPAGATLTLCSDGLVFADAVSVGDADVAAYGAEIDRILLDLPHLRRFDLTDAFGELSPDEARRRLLSGWGESESVLTEEAKRSPALGAQLDGLHRFMFEDGLALSPGVSRTQVRKRAREKAVDVLLRSRAWGRMLAATFPQAIRLSIHPQPLVSDKIGIHLLPTHDAWLTPWHGVALLESDRFRLVKRKEAEELGAKPVEAGGRLSHYILTA